MLYQLKNGKTIDIPVEVFLDKTDDELLDLEGTFGGSEIPDPFCNSVINGNPDVPCDEELSEADLEVEQDLTELSPEEKFVGLDVPVE